MTPEMMNACDDLFWQLETIVRTDPSSIKYLSPKWKSMERAAKNCERVIKLMATKDWVGCPQSVQLELTTDKSAPFVTVMAGLAKRGYRVNQTSMVLWWRRVVATGNEHVITYFGWADFVPYGDTVVGTDILRQCLKNEQTLETFSNALRDDKTVDFRIRELLGGLSMQSDVRAAWKKWVMTHHPDKGGDPEVFLTVKLVYEEWIELQKENNNAQTARSDVGAHSDAPRHTDKRRETEEEVKQTDTNTQQKEVNKMAKEFETEVLNAPEQGSEDWLNWRKAGITATEAGVIMHPSYGKSALTVYNLKVGITEPDNSDEEGYMEWGHRIEDDCVEKFMETHPDFHDCTTGRLYQKGWCKCSLDAQCYDANGEPVIIECKTGQDEDKWSPVPENYYAQVQWQMYCTGIRRAFFSVLIKGHIWFEREVRYNPDFVDKMLERCRMVWDCINIKTPPALFTDGEADKSAIAAMAGETGHGGEPVEVDEADVQEYIRLKALADEAAEAFANFKNRISFKMVESSRLVRSNGRTFASWVERKGSVTVDKELLKSKYPEIYEECLKQGAGSRYIKYQV